MSQTTISLEEALRHHEGWSEETRAFVRREIDRIGGVQFRNDVHGYWNSIKVYDAKDEFVADILKTKIWYAAAVAPPGTVEVNSWGNVAIRLDGVQRRRPLSREPRRSERAICLNADCAEVNQAHAGECW